MSEFNADILPLKNLNYHQFKIPDYQRPYVWAIKETRQLWDDILMSMEQQKKDYRLGTIILHDNEETNTLDIVDGQQRLTTLSLLMYFLNEENHDLPCSIFLEQKQFLHKDSVDNIQNNATELKQWIDDELTTPNVLLHYLLNHCSIVEIRVSNISEAFQMFDSQNGRGLLLEPYNLLKAYHLRYFNDIPQEDKISFDRSWENAAKNKDKKDYLKQVISEQLYRTREWSKHYSAYTFSKKEITEFKGSAINHVKYPYQNFVNHLPASYGGKDIKRLKEDVLSTKTQINQAIINGTPFFEYIGNYVTMYKLLFEQNYFNNELDNFYSFYKEYCTGFKKKGDYYLLELYKSMIMLVFDKFGSVGLKKYYLLLYAYVFRFRLEKKFVKYDSVAQFPSAVISRIQHAKELLDLNFIKDYALDDIERQESNVNNDIVEYFFENHFNVNIY